MLRNISHGLLLGLALLGLLAAPRGRSALELTPICQIQGSGFSSPYLGQTVTAQGVVHADLDQTAQRGFFLQAEACDGDPLTSDGIFVYLGERLDVVQSGDLVEVTGLAQEYYGQTEIAAAPDDVVVLSSGNPLPIPTELNPPFDNQGARSYLESRESMRVGLAQAVVVGPTSDDDETWLVSAGLGIGRVFHDDPLGTGEVLCAGDEGLYEIAPEAAVGDQILGLLGALDYSFGAYCLALSERPALLPGESAAAPPGAYPYTLATFNLHNLFDTLDDPATQDTVLSQAEYQRRLSKRALAIHADLGEPTLLALQEVENLGVLQALASQPEIAASYAPVWLDGPDFRGLDVALLYRPDQASLLSYRQEQGCTALVDGLGPDGNNDPQNPQNALTCDSDGDGSLDGNRLFSRPPLLVQLQLLLPPSAAADRPAEEAPEAWLIVNHWSSKIYDTATVQYTLPRRLQQAQFVAGLAAQIQAGAPGSSLFILGDLNDNPDSAPLEALRLSGLRDLSQQVSREERYSYLYQGVSLQFDYLFARLDRRLALLGAGFSHINADYPAVFAGDAGTSRRSSDHDPFRAGFDWHDWLLYLPMAAAR